MPPSHGATPTARRPSGTRATGRCAAACSISRSCPTTSNSIRHFQQFQWVGEIEHRHELWGQPGKIAVTGFLSRGRMGSYEDAIALAAITGGPADTPPVRQYRSRRGVSMNIEQQITSDLGRFRPRRLGRTAMSSPTSSPTSTARWRPVCRSKAKQWGRPDDTFGICRRGQRDFGRARRVPQCRRARHSGRRRTTAASRARTDHRDLLQLPDRLLAASRWTISSSPIPPTTATAGRFPSSARGCTRSFETGSSLLSSRTRPYGYLLSVQGTELESSRRAMLTISNEPDC